jgi:hypothetical protein
MIMSFFGVEIFSREGNVIGDMPVDVYLYVMSNIKIIILRGGFKSGDRNTVRN